MRPVSHSGARRSEILFAIGNLVPALVLGVGLFALPTRWWPADVTVGSAVVGVLVTSVCAVARPELARLALRVGAGVLLALGLVIVGTAALSLAFLAGIHGDFGQGGVALMLLVTFLVLPYAVVYPLIELRFVAPRASAALTPPAPKPPVEAPSGDGGAAA
ncbi:MAG TPA: hypothetical protein VMI54_18690 [Polyangiaceae bacterium]|nr:hypothetical protein [Polyangiaceae bacterium]